MCICIKVYFNEPHCLLILVELRCESDSMTAVITTGGPFRGKVFALTHPSECYNIGKETEKITLSIPLHDRQCGTQSMVGLSLH